MQLRSTRLYIEELESRTLLSLLAAGAGPGNAPEVKVFDPSTGVVKLDFMAYSTSFTGGVRVAVGDVNGDGVPDIITAPGPGGGPDIRVFDGNSGQMIGEFLAYDYHFDTGVYVAVADLNHDGYADIITSPDQGGGPDIRIFEGKSIGLNNQASMTAEFLAYDYAFQGGVRLAVGDINGSGTPDVITAPGPGGGPDIRVFSGASLGPNNQSQMIGEFLAYDYQFNNGVYVAAGDVNGDGKSDIITGPDQGGGPDVRVFDGSTVGLAAAPAMLNEFMAYDPAFQGGVRVAAVNSLTNNGKADIAAAPGAPGGVPTTVYDGLTGTVLWSTTPFATAAAQVFVGGDPLPAVILNTQPVITTPFDTIPNFGANPTIYTVASGNWSNPGIWNLGRIPTAGDIVDITSGFSITYDLNSTVALNTVEVQGGGDLHFRTDINTQIIVGNFLVLFGGSLEVGTKTTPIASNVFANILIADQANNTTIDPMQYGSGLIVLGSVTMFGAARTPTYVALATEPHAGDTTLTLAQPVTGWQAGDEIVIPDSRQLTLQQQSNYLAEYDDVFIQSVSADGLVVTLSSPLLYDHPGAYDVNGVLDYLPHVINYSRNIMVSSQNPNGTRGFVMFTYRAAVDIENAGFCELGRTTYNPFDDTTFNSSGQVTHSGTNQEGRYSMFLNHLYGPATTPSDGYQFTLIGDEVDQGAGAASQFRWGIALNDSHYGLVQGNDVYNTAGAGIVTVSGSESYNLIENNIVARVNGTGGRADARYYTNVNDVAFEGSAFWFRGPNNYIENNVATDAVDYGYTIFNQYASYTPPIVNIPAYKGADPTVPGQAASLNLFSTPLLTFSGNEAYGNPSGMTVWNLGATTTSTSHGIGVSMIQGLVVWGFYTYGFYGYATNNVTFNGLVMRGGPLPTSGDTVIQGIGLFFSDYLTANLTVENSDIQGLGTGIDMPAKVGDTRDTGTTVITTTVVNTLLRDYTNILVTPSWGITGGGVDLSPSSIVLTSDTFDQMLTNNQNYGPQSNIDMDYQTGNQNTNFVQLIQVLVNNYNTTAGDNFQVYFTQQSSTSIVPVTGGGNIGAPVANLTNQQAWTDYALAIAGAVAPANTFSMAGIIGLVT
jgi:hypothetical protein